MNVVIARYVRNPDNYFFDLFDVTAAALLRQTGHNADVVEVMALDRKGNGVSPDLLVEAMRPFSPDVVFLPYLPQRELAVVIAEELSPQIVAFGSRLLLEIPEVSFVLPEVDPLACAQLVENLASHGELGGIPGLCFRDQGNVGVNPGPVHSVKEIFEAALPDYSTLKSYGPGKPVEVRKHVAGDWGCPYRHTLATGVDFGSSEPSVLSGGCTFCSRPYPDGTPVGQKCDVIESQLRVLLPAFPLMRKLILIDEMGLAYVDRVAGILDELGVWDLQLLVSGRLDHLSRYQENLFRALEILKPRNAGIRLYQFGIENLSDSVLVRYNKGISYDGIRTGIGRISEWTSRSSNLTVEPSFGFILFDPWTTPDELWENVERRVESQLDKVRGQAVFTHLRLQPEIPLFWQARADGLLDESVADSAFGYSANAGWRFADPRVGRVYEELNARRGEEPPWVLLRGALLKFAPREGG